VIGLGRRVVDNLGRNLVVLCGRIGRTGVVVSAVGDAGDLAVVMTSNSTFEIQTVRRIRTT